MEPKYEFVKLKHLLPVLDKEMEMSVFGAIGDAKEFEDLGDEKFKNMSKEIYDSLIVVHITTTIIEKDGESVPVILVFVSDKAQAVLVPKEISGDNN